MYEITKVLPITILVEIINKNKLAIIVVGVDNQTFMIHIKAIAWPIIILIYFSYES